MVRHSSGAYLAVSVLADVLRAAPLDPSGPALNFLSLGQVVPMVSFLPNAGRLRADLKYLAGCDQLAWVEVTALGDVCALALELPRRRALRRMCQSIPRCANECRFALT